MSEIKGGYAEVGKFHPGIHISYELPSDSLRRVAAQVLSALESEFDNIPTGAMTSGTLRIRDESIDASISDPPSILYQRRGQAPNRNNIQAAMGAMKMINSLNPGA